MRWRGTVSIVWLLLSWAALDDITTDNANSFPLEYSILIVAGLWFAGLGAWLIAKRLTVPGACSLFAVAIGIVAFWSLPHHYQPPSFTNYFGYVPLAWFLGMTVWLFVAQPVGRAASVPASRGLGQNAARALIARDCQDPVPFEDTDRE